MKLIREFVENNVDLLEFVDKKSGQKDVYITGPFMQAEDVNKNGRIYPKSVIEGQVRDYQNAISSGKATGELGHPNTPSINLHLISHLVTELKMNGNIAEGKAKILDTPMGNTAKGLLKGGVKLGVSSRGLGSIKESKGQRIVQPDFKLAAIDIVADPSAPKAWMESVMENVEWYQDSKGEWLVNEAKKQIRSMSKRQIEENGVKLFQNFLNDLSSTKFKF